MGFADGFAAGGAATRNFGSLGALAIGARQAATAEQQLLAALDQQALDNAFREKRLRFESPFGEFLSSLGVDEGLGVSGFNAGGGPAGSGPFGPELPPVAFGNASGPLNLPNFGITTIGQAQANLAVETKRREKERAESEKIDEQIRELELKRAFKAGQRGGVGAGDEFFGVPAPGLGPQPIGSSLAQQQPSRLPITEAQRRRLAQQFRTSPLGRLADDPVGALSSEPLQILFEALGLKDPISSLPQAAPLEQPDPFRNSTFR